MDLCDVLDDEYIHGHGWNDATDSQRDAHHDAKTQIDQTELYNRRIEIGVASTMNARSSMKLPPASKMRNDEDHHQVPGSGRPEIQSAAIMGIFVTARKWPITVDHGDEEGAPCRPSARLPRLLLCSLQRKVPLISTSRSTANVPTLPASVG